MALRCLALGLMVGFVWPLAAGLPGPAVAQESTLRNGVLGVMSPASVRQLRDQQSAAATPSQGGTGPSRSTSSTSAAAVTAPKSAIDWLNGLSNARVAVPAPRPSEPPVSAGASIPQVSSRPLGDTRPGAVGLLPVSVTGLPATLWERSSAATLSRQLQMLDVAQQPAMQSLLYTLLLAEVEPPDSDAGSEDFLIARIDKLIDLGAVDPAMALIERAGPTRSPALFARWFDLSLLSGDEDAACRQMLATPALAPGYGARIFCLARQQDWDTAALLLDTATAIGALDGSEQMLLNRFLNDSLDDGAVPMAPPADVTPLTFRLAEAIGAPLPTASLPRAFAASDLRGVTGWKAALEAAERLTRTGALSENSLLGIYTQARPSASGGVWERVRAIQDFDRAMEAGDRQAVLDALPEAWLAMTSAELEVPFARLYGDRLVDYADAPGEAGEIAFRVALLGPGYEAAAQKMTARNATGRYLLALAKGQPGSASPYDEASRIVSRGFADPPVLPQRLQDQLDNGQLGQALLGAMRLYGTATTGELRDVAEALATFRSVRLEDTARSAALQFLILDRRG